MLENEITEKQCTLCKKPKPIAEFVSAFTTSYTNRCAECREQGQRAHAKYIKKNPEKWNRHHSEYVKRRLAEKPKRGHQICQRCLDELPNKEFPIGPDGQRFKSCIKCRAYNATHLATRRVDYPAKAAVLNQRAKERQQAKRRKCLEHYGLACACCGEATYEFLTMDHVDGKGGIHRAELHASSIYGWLIKNNFPPGFRTLCWNCQWGYRLYGVCPHQTAKAA
jgi:hypothetical protein